MTQIVKTSLKVAAVDFVPAWGNLEGNIQNLVEAVKAVAEKNIDYAVFPETAVSGYLFSDNAELEPYLDTIPGKTTDAVLPLLKAHNMYMSIGIAEKDIQTGVPYNAAVLMGPEGIIGTYRKIGLNSQDQKVFAPGNSDIKVFDTPIGKIGLLICYDDTYWQYARIAMLKGAQIIGWHSVSDRVMPGSSPSEMVGDHSTVSHVQHMSALNGTWTICATRSGIETNPITKGQLYYNGGSSIWSPTGHNIAQSPIATPLELPAGLHGIFTAIIDLTEADSVQKNIKKRRRLDLYNPLLAFHRCPTDENANLNRRDVTLVAAQWAKADALLENISINENQLLVLPEFSSFEQTNDPQIILSKAEKRGEKFETTLCEISGKGKGFIVGSYPEIDIDKLYHTVVLAGPEGTVLARYRVTHLNERDRGWASPGDKMSVTETAIGRIALAAAYEFEVSEVGGMIAALRGDIIAAPAGLPCELKVEIDAKLYSVATPPTGQADFYPYVTATLTQSWVVCGGRSEGDFTAAAIYGPEPIVLTETLLAKAGEDSVSLSSTVPAPYTWLNQNRLIHGQAAVWFPALVSLN